MILAEARRLEDKYYTEVQKKLINEQEVKQIDKDETQELQSMVDQYLWEESWGDCPMEKLLLLAKHLLTYSILLQLVQLTGYDSIFSE